MDRETIEAQANELKAHFDKKWAEVGDFEKWYGSVSFKVTAEINVDGNFFTMQRFKTRWCVVWSHERKLCEAPTKIKSLFHANLGQMMQAIHDAQMKEKE